MAFTGTNAQIYNATLAYMNENNINTSLPTEYDINALRDLFNGREEEENALDFNKFYSTLYKLISKQFFEQSGNFVNPLKMFGKGSLPVGANVQGIYVEKAEAMTYDPNASYNEVFKRAVSTIYSKIYEDVYKDKFITTTSYDNAQESFLTETGINQLTAQILNSMYEGKEYTEYERMKKALNVAYLSGYMYPVGVAEVIDTASAKAIVEQAKAWGKKWKYYKRDFNYIGASRSVDMSRQVIVTTPEISAKIDVEVLALAFNMDKTTIRQRIIEVDDFGTTIEGAELSEIQMMLLDMDFIQYYEMKNTTASIYNPDGLYMNNFLHHWYNLGVSPFANAMVFVKKPTIGALSIAGASSVVKDTPSEYTVSVTGDNSNSVKWSVTAVSGSELKNTIISKNGVLIVDPAYTGASVTVKATSLLNPTKSTTKSVTVTAQ